MSQPKSKLFIFLHGYNAQGDAMKVLDSVFKKVAPEGSVFLYPDAPFTAPEGDGFCWFPFVFGDDPMEINEEFVYQSMQQAMPYLKSYIETKLKELEDFNYEDIVLIGFSQGAALALHASMHLPSAISCVISFSGGLANPDNIIAKKEIHKAPVLLIHGMDDKILPYLFSQRGAKMLREAGFNVELHLLKDTGHIITPEAMEIAKNFLTHEV